MALTKETEDYIAGWKKQAATHINKGDLNEMYNRFRLLLQIYNRLYNEVAFSTGKKHELDRNGATEEVVQYLTADYLEASINGNNETKNAVEELKKFIRNHTYHFDL